MLRSFPPQPLCRIPRPRTGVGPLPQHRHAPSQHRAVVNWLPCGRRRRLPSMPESKSPTTPCQDFFHANVLPATRGFGSPLAMRWISACWTRIASITRSTNACAVSPGSPAASVNDSQQLGPPLVVPSPLHHPRPGSLFRCSHSQPVLLCIFPVPSVGGNMANTPGQVG